ncbi:MAG: hypothetical protein ABL973_08645 [Micropepsaceae bacterium]
MVQVSKIVVGLSGLVACVSIAGTALADDPLMGKSPWNFSYQNRAAIAIAIKNAENPGSGTGGSTIICGGTSGASGQGATGSGASSTANSSCIILNNSPGSQVHNDQTSTGDQTSTSTTKTSASKPGGSIDEVSSILYGQKQGL